MSLDFNLTAGKWVGYERITVDVRRWKTRIDGVRQRYHYTRYHWVKKFVADEKEPPIDVVRVTVGTGISVQNRSGKGLVLSFTWVKTVLTAFADEAAEEGKEWIRAKFGAEAGKLSKKYLKGWGLEDMMNFDGYDPNGEMVAADFRDLGKLSKTWTENGVEHEEGEG